MEATRKHRKWVEQRTWLLENGVKEKDLRELDEERSFQVELRSAMFASFEDHMWSGQRSKEENLEGFDGFQSPAINSPLQLIPSAVIKTQKVGIPPVKRSNSQ